MSLEASVNSACFRSKKRSPSNSRSLTSPAAWDEVWVRSTEHVRASARPRAGGVGDEPRQILEDAPWPGSDVPVARGQPRDFPCLLETPAPMSGFGSGDALLPVLPGRSPHPGARSSAMTGGCGARLAPTPSAWRHLVGSRRASWRILHLTQFRTGASLGAAPSRAVRRSRAE